MRVREDIKLNPWQLKFREVAAEKDLSLSDLKNLYRSKHNGSSWGFECIGHHWYGDRSNPYLTPAHSTHWEIISLLGVPWGTFDEAIEETNYLRYGFKKYPSFPITEIDRDKVHKFVVDNYPCDFCKEPAGSDCVTISGKAAEGFHSPRRAVTHALYKQELIKE